MSFAYITSPIFFEHLTGDHPENPGRLESINKEIGKLIPSDQWIEPRDATPEELKTIHTETDIFLVKEACQTAVPQLDFDTPVSEKSYAAAIKAAGAGCTAVEMMIDGKIKRAFCAVRPPGHHAEANQAMGFCLFNNIAITARHAQKKGIKKIAIVDFDVHHGNGTEHSFYDDPTIFFSSFHRWGIYPGTGAAEDRGGKGAQGTNINFPLMAGSGDSEYMMMLRNSLIPKLEEFNPELLLISAGFDAHESDPLGGMALTDNGYRKISETLLDFAKSNCGGKIISLLEGGYNLNTLGTTTAAHVKAIM